MENSQLKIRKNDLRFTVLFTAVMVGIFLITLCSSGIFLSGDALGYLSNGVSMIESRHQMPNVISWADYVQGDIVPGSDMEYPNKLFSLIYGLLFLNFGCQNFVMIIPGILSFGIGMYCFTKLCLYNLTRYAAASLALFFFFTCWFPLTTVNRTDLYSWAVLMVAVLVAYETPRKAMLVGFLVGVATLIRAQCAIFVPFLPFLFNVKKIDARTYGKLLLKVCIPFLVVIGIWWGFCNQYVKADEGDTSKIKSFYLNEIIHLWLPKLNPLRLIALILAGTYSITTRFFSGFSLLLLVALHPCFRSRVPIYANRGLFFAIPVLLMPYIQYENANDVRYLWMGLFYLSLFLWCSVNDQRTRQPWISMLCYALLLISLNSSGLLDLYKNAHWDKQNLRQRLLGADLKNLSETCNHYLKKNAIIIAPGLDYGAANLRGAWLSIFLETKNIVYAPSYDVFLHNDNSKLDAILIMHYRYCDVDWKHSWNYVPGWMEEAYQSDRIVDEEGNEFIAVHEYGMFDMNTSFYKLFIRRQ